MKLVVIGGVAGGMSAAARARRIDEHAEIVVFEAGEYVSFANCGLPYHLAGEIEERDALLLHTPESLARRSNLDVRIETRVTRINRDAKTVTVVGPEGEYEEAYDKLILAPGSVAVTPPIEGIDHPAVSTLRTIPEMDKVISLAEAGLAKSNENRAAKAIVIGAGFIGLEAVEALVHRGFEVELVEFASHVLPMMDGDLAVVLHRELRANGVGLHLGVGASKFEDGDGYPVQVTLSDGKQLQADVVVTAMGVRPNSQLAKDAGLELGERGGILTDANQITSDPDILAVGDAVEVQWADGSVAPVMLAGPANRQGRRAADVALGRKPIRQAPVLGTAGIRLFNYVAAFTGASSEKLDRMGIEHTTVRIHAANHAGYYPGSTPIHLNANFAPDGRLLGAAAVSKDGAERRIDVLATAIRAGMTAEDLAELELTYAPPIGAAKDPINILGFVARNTLEGNAPIWDFSDFEQVKADEVILDVRPTHTIAPDRVIREAVAIPIFELRGRLDELREIAGDRAIAVHCKTGLNAYLAERILSQEGFKVRNLTGGYDSFDLANEAAQTSK